MWLSSCGLCPDAIVWAERTPPASPAATAEPQAPCAAGTQADESRVLLQSDTLEYFQQDKRVVATGNVTVTYRDKRLTADQLELYTDKNTGTAWGHVRLQSPDDDLQAARIDFDFASERGVLYDSSGKVAKVYHVAGERIERVEAQSFAVQHGRLTTCSGAVPDWEFRAPETHLTLEDYATMKHPSFWIKGIPVFYLPYFIFPTKQKRTTGLLPPTFGISEQSGQIVGESFFWAINDWMDTTVGAEYLSKKGWKPEVEYRYALDPQSDGQLKGAFIRERDTGLDLWRVLLQQRQDFGWGIRGLSQIDLRSEGDIVRRFARTIAEESAIRTASFGALTKLFPLTGVTLTGASYDGIPESGTTQQFRYLPSLRLSQFPTALPLNLFFALETSYNQFVSSDILQATPVQRLELFPRLSFPLALRPWVNVTVTGGIHTTFYDHRLQVENGQEQVAGASILRQVPDLTATLEGPTLRRRYTALLPGQEVIHTITPRVAYRYVPAVQQNDIPPFEALDELVHFLDPLETFPLVDRIQAANYAKLSLLHRLYTRGTAATGTRGAREVARLILSQGVDMRRAADERTQLVGPLDVDFELRLWPRWWLEGTWRLAPMTGTLQEAYGRLGLSLWSGASLSLTSFRRQSPDVNYLLGTLQAEVLRGLSLSYNLRYDARTEEFREHLFLLHYQAECWRFDARFRLREAGDTDFFFQINLLTL